MQGDYNLEYCIVGGGEISPFHICLCVCVGVGVWGCVCVYVCLELRQIIPFILTTRHDHIWTWLAPPSGGAAVILLLGNAQLYTVEWPVCSVKLCLPAFPSSRQSLLKAQSPKGSLS